MKKLNLGVVGCGAVAHRWYLSGLSGEHESYRLLAVCDHDRARAEACSDRYGALRVHPSLTSMLADQDVDIVVVLTHHKDHFAHVQAALRAGKHVYAEKPLADTAPAARELMRIASEHGVVLASAPQVMLSARNQRIAELIQGGRIGKVTLIRVSSSNLGPANRIGVDYDPRWFYQDGGSVRSLGIYGLAALLWIMGKPKLVSCYRGIAIPSRVVQHGPYQGTEFAVTAPDNEVAIFDFGEGCYALFDGSYSVANQPLREFEFQGSDGSLYAGGFGGPESVQLQSIRGKVEDVGPDTALHQKWTLAWGVEDLVEAVHQKRAPRAHPQFATDVIEVLDAMTLSSIRGQHVLLEATP